MDSSYFSDLIASAQIQTSSRYFEAGVYLVEIDNCKFFTNRQRRPRAAVECTVIDTNNVNFPQTTQLSWVVSLDSDSGPSALKGFISGVMGCKESEITNEAISKIFIYSDSPNSENTPSIAIGLKALVHAHAIQTQKGGTFTKLSWRGFNADTDERPDFSKMQQVGHVEETVEDVDSQPVGTIPF